MLLTIGVAALALAVWIGEPAPIRAAGLALAAGALIFAATAARVLHHLTACPLKRPAPGMPHVSAS